MAGYMYKRTIFNSAEKSGWTVGMGRGIWYSVPKMGNAARTVIPETASVC